MKIIIISFTKTGYGLSESLQTGLKCEDVKLIYRGRKKITEAEGAAQPGTAGAIVPPEAATALAHSESVSACTRPEAATANAHPEAAVYTDKNKDVSLSDICRGAFEDKTALIFIGAVGIAVRHIAPFVKDKLSDPPVLVMDEKALHVIPLLSGHVGGANELAMKIAEITGADPVLTTATDVEQAFSVDLFAKENGLKIVNREGIAKVSVKALEGKPIVLSIKNYPPSEHVDVVITDDEAMFDAADIALMPQQNASFKDDDIVSDPERRTIPSDSAATPSDSATTPSDITRIKPIYCLGIGCKKGKPAGDIEKHVLKVLDENNISIEDIYSVGTIDLKKDEPGLLAFTKKYSLPLIVFEAAVLKKASGDFSRSEFVAGVTGVDNVCERAAVLAAGPGAKLTVRKTASDGVTVALAVRKLHQTE